MVNWRKKHCFWGAEKACLSHFSQYLIAVSVLFPSLNPRGEEERTRTWKSLWPNWAAKAGKGLV